MSTVLRAADSPVGLEIGEATMCFNHQAAARKVFACAAAGITAASAVFMAPVRIKAVRKAISIAIKEILSDACLQNRAMPLNAPRSYGRPSREFLIDVIDKGGSLTCFRYQPDRCSHPVNKQCSRPSPYRDDLLRGCIVDWLLIRCATRSGLGPGRRLRTTGGLRTLARPADAFATDQFANRVRRWNGGVQEQP